MMNISFHFMPGTSSGFGRRLTSLALARGDRVIATARTLSKIEHFTQHPNLHLMQLDVNAGAKEIKARIDHAARVWNGIDVLVNNAGYGLPALLEEGGYAHQPRALHIIHVYYSASVMLRQFQTNFFGVVNVCNAALPHMRKSECFSQGSNSFTCRRTFSRTQWHSRGHRQQECMEAGNQSKSF